MGMALLRELEDRFQADLWTGALSAEGVPHLLRTYQDTAYDGLFVSQRGYASLYVDEQWLDQAREIDAGLMNDMDSRGLDPLELARAIDHTLLDPMAGPGELESHLAQCLEMGCAAACVLPWMVADATRALAGSRVAVCTVVSFPLGADTTPTKRRSARELAQAGAAELDVVFNRGLFLGGRPQEAVEEMAELAEAVKPAVVKVILETSALGPEKSREAAGALAGSGVAFLKTGSGHFGPATVGDVELLIEAGHGLAVKAAGGIKKLEQAAALLKAGATRLGTSSGHDIWQQAMENWPSVG